jgi:esterase/lipase
MIASLRFLASLLIFVCVSNLMIAAECNAQTLRPKSETPQVSFGAYVKETRQLIQSHRLFHSAYPSQELDWNAPSESRPIVPGGKAILLIHGLGDSPWSFVDVARDLVAEGYVVRTLLLAGHGTKPVDMIGVRLEEWQQVVREHVALLHQEFSDVYLGGFSTGANLALEYAMNDPDVRGLVLFSPAFRSDQSFDWMTPLLARFKTWIFSPNSSRPQQSPVRYYNVPTNGFAQFYRSSVAVRRLIENRDFDRPVVIVLAEHDSVVDVRYVRELFERRFTHRASRLIWYGRDLSLLSGSSRILARTDYIPRHRISHFSHMGILFSPENPLYGTSGTERFCWNGQSDEDHARCEAGSQVWYSDWGYRAPGKIHARLTFNPYFDWQSQIIREVLETDLP